MRWNHVESWLVTTRGLNLHLLLFCDLEQGVKTVVIFADRLSSRDLFKVRVWGRKHGEIRNRRVWIARSQTHDAWLRPG